MKKYLIARWKKCQIVSNLLIVCFFAFFVNPTLIAQKTTKVKGIKGQGYISGNTSPVEARAMALNEAKLNALKAAGIAENIKSYELLFNSQDNSDFTQIMNSDVQSEISGAIKEYTIKSENQTKINNEFAIEIVIDAVVIHYDNKPDLSFKHYIEGLKAYYQNGERLSFNFKSTQGCFLTIFVINPTEVSLFYPNKYEKQKLFQPELLNKFPTGSLNYNLSLPPQQKQEENMFVFVFTKKQIPFINMDENQIIKERDDVFSWIYAITPDERNVEYRKIIIGK